MPHHTRRSFILSYSALALVASVLPSISLAKDSVKFIPLTEGFSAKIGADDECSMCGMMIKRFPGPKGEVYLRNQPKMLKYCSTKDMFSQILDPEYTHQVKAAYVHDMGATDWDAPGDEFFIDATSAYYVVGSSEKGAMGSTLVSFSEETKATAFSEKFGGKVVEFKNINMSLL